MSGTLLKGCDTILPWDIPYFGDLLMVVENAVSGDAPESPKSLNWFEIWWLRRPWHVVYIVFIIKLFRDHSCLLMGALSSYGGTAMVAKTMARFLSHTHQEMWRLHTQKGGNVSLLRNNLNKCGSLERKMTVFTFLFSAYTIIIIALEGMCQS